MSCAWRRTATAGSAGRWGAFYWDERFNLVSGTFNGVGGVQPTRVTDIVQKSDSWSVFGQGSYKVTDALKVTAGVRYTDDNRYYNGRIVLGNGAGGTGAVSVGDQQVSWDVSAVYQVNDDLNLFRPAWPRGIAARRSRGATCRS